MPHFPVNGNPPIETTNIRKSATHVPRIRRKNPSISPSNTKWREKMCLVWYYIHVFFNCIRTFINISYDTPIRILIIKWKKERKGHDTYPVLKTLLPPSLWQLWSVFVWLLSTPVSIPSLTVHSMLGTN